MQIYHGSEVIIKNPQYNLGKPYNDFGRGFYCTKDIEKAKEWACKNNRNGIVNIYKLNTVNLKILDLTNNEYNVLNWISILLQNRTFEINNEITLKVKNYLIQKYSIDLKKYDVVIGYRADDSYFSYAQSFLNNSISVENLQKAMEFGNLGKQIVLVSKKAFDNITYIGNLPVDKHIYYTRFINGDQKARNSYKDIKSLENETYVIDILRRGSK